MDHYNHTRRLREIWQQAVEKYKDGKRRPESYFESNDLDFLSKIGLGVMDVYDYAEDFVCGGEPDFETFLTICEVRRDYFLTVQEGQPSEARLHPDLLPSKTDSVRGIVWLPRILPKAIAKLRGEMPPEIMYGCGGDRNFFRENNIHPAEFLRIVWSSQGDVENVIDWVESRRNEARG